MSLRLRFFSLVSRFSLKLVLSYSQNVAFIRKSAERGLRSMTAKVPNARFSKTSLTAQGREVPTVIAQMDGASDTSALLYIHGGGFVFGSARAYRNFGAELSRRLNCPVYLPDYVLAPEHKFPQGLNDIKASYQALMDRGIKPENILLGGDSAGGNLVLALLQNLLADGAPLPACAFAISPVTDFTYASTSMVTNARSDAVLAARQSVYLRDLYIGDHDPTDPNVSPLFGAFQGAPPILIHASTSEILRDDSYRMTERLIDQKVDARVRFWPNNFHVFHLLFSRVPEADEALDEITRFGIKHLTPTAIES